MQRKGIFFIVLLFMVWGCINPEPEVQTGRISIIPEPAQTEISPGFFQIDEHTALVFEGKDNEGAAGYFAHWFKGVSGIDLVEGEDKKSNRILFLLSDEDKFGEEGYELKVDEDGVTLSAYTPAGIFYGVQSLLQLLPVEVFSKDQQPGIAWQIPHCEIQDHPRFPWRGMHLDVSRHFFPVDFIKKYIDLIAMHKMNVFHWHLTDDNGWRIEIKKYPKLTEVAAWRVDREDMPWREVTPPTPGEKATYGGFYTQEEVREVIAYAAERHVTVIPEIEMPGHTSEVFAAYPELSCRGEKLYVQPGSYWPNIDIFCAGKEETFEFIEGVLEEVIALFPTQYVHIGGDEATKTRWEECPRCQRRIRKEGLANEDELQSWFIRRIERFLAEKGKKLIGWDEILEGGLAPEATVMSWRGEKGGIAAARMGHDVVMCPTSHCYFDYYQANPDFEPEAIGGFTTLKKVYQYEPVPEVLEEEQQAYILGAQGNVWTEYISTPEHAEYMAVPRMTALAEVTWSPKNKTSWNSFQERLQDQLQRFDNLGVNYSDGSWAVEIVPVMKEGTYFIELASEQFGQPIYYTLDGSDPTEGSDMYETPLKITGSAIVKAALFKDGALMEYASTKEIVYHMATGKPVELMNMPSRNYFANGAISLVDGLKGSDDFRDGYWLGFEGIDLEALIDLEKEVPVSRVYADFYQNTGSWIFLPETITFSLLDNDRNLIAEMSSVPEATMEVKGTIIEGLEASFNSGLARYVSIKATSMKEIPGWHEGAGHKGWIFVDEIIVE